MSEHTRKHAVRWVASGPAMCMQYACIIFHKMSGSWQQLEINMSVEVVPAEIQFHCCVHYFWWIVEFCAQWHQFHSHFVQLTFSVPLSYVFQRAIHCLFAQTYKFVSCYSNENIRRCRSTASAYLVSVHEHVACMSKSTHINIIICRQSTRKQQQQHREKRQK